MPAPLALLAAVALTLPPAGPPGEPHAGKVYDGRSGALAITTPREATAISVDGVLDEPAWRKAALLTGFSQYFPTDGVPARDSTEVFVFYTSTALHVGIRAYAPAGTVRHNLADRDKITADDNIQLFLGTYNDSRQAMLFAVNPIGIQSDGVLIETGTVQGGGFSGGIVRTREAADLAPDYVWKSKGHVTEYGFEVEIQIPFKSLRYRAGGEQQWQLNVVRTVQATGYEETWAPTTRAGSSFLAQSGRLEGLRDLSRGLTVDVIPTVTSSVVGVPATGGWGYENNRPELGGSVRWGITSNLTLSGTANPDFSQVEADATQFTYDPRVQNFFAERRPFFLESQEQFSAPSRLIYTRRITQPVAATKLTGKLNGFDIGLLSAIDNREASVDGRQNPVFNVLRVQRDVGTQSRIGLVYTDKMDGGAFNRVAGLDGRLVRGIVSVQGQYATSFTRTGGVTASAPLFSLAANVNGRRFGAQYAVNGIAPDFDAQSGFIARTGIANVNITNRFTFLGGPGALVEALTPEIAWLNSFRYDDFVRGGPVQDEKLHFRLNSRLKRGWSVGAQLLLERFSYDPELYADYVYIAPAGTGIDTVGYRGTPNLVNVDWVGSVNTPEFKRFSLTSFVLYGVDENFPEWSSARIAIVNLGVNVRPTDQLRIAGTWNVETYDRRTDGSRVLTRNVPRVRVEYQVTRQVFVRVIGEVAKLQQDSLRDDSRTNAPVYFRNADGTLTRAVAFDRLRGRLDFLFSYLPTPGTVIYLGYGNTSRADRPGGTQALQPNRDVFFMKFSYLFRLQ
ncbi:MAG: carbohydrate binding family 9 domain-containing protein [Gemmatimonadaceae bacterium]|nr:carbohydrate binding family 9 domain-containing protein [Gemmatimonadaceae bacterium]